MRFSLRALLVIIAIVALGIVLVSWYRTDTIFYSANTATLTLPNGKVVSTNRWYRHDETVDFVLMQTEIKGEFHLMQTIDESKIATITSDGKTYAAVVTYCRFQGPTYRAEIWIRCGELKESK